MALVALSSPKAPDSHAGAIDHTEFQRYEDDRGIQWHDV